MLNPKIKDLLKEKPEMTLLGFWWAIQWRLSLVVLGIYLIFLVSAMLVSLLSTI